MIREICDVCKERDADYAYKVKSATRSNRFRDGWSPYEKIVICEVCGEKLLGIDSSKTKLKRIIGKR